MACDITWSEKSPIEIGTGIFAAEFIFPEIEMVNLLNNIDIIRGRSQSRDVVRFKKVARHQSVVNF
jgi:hypothetical protein